jgi:hypothetical protein
VERSWGSSWSERQRRAGESDDVVFRQARVSANVEISKLRDPAAHSLYSSVLLHASQPYARTLIRWITTGTLKDPYDEFLIKEDSRINKGQLVYDYSDEYWERRYTVGVAHRDCHRG